MASFKGTTLTVSSPLQSLLFQQQPTKPMMSSLLSATASRIFASSFSSVARLSLRATPRPYSFSSSLKSLALSSHFSPHQKDGPGAPGGQSWTVQWLKFDNSYFKDIKAKRDEDLLVLPTDAALFKDPSFKVYAEKKYAEDQETYFKDYAEAHAKLSNLGAKFDPTEGIVLP